MALTKALYHGYLLLFDFDNITNHPVFLKKVLSAKNINKNINNPLILLCNR